MSQLVTKANVFFFGEEEISFSDAVWFYGMYTVVAIGIIYFAMMFISAISV